MFNKRLTTGLLAIGAAGLLAGSASAKAPGVNGRIAFQDGDGGIHTIRPDGSDVRQVASEAEQAHWSSDGRRIAIAKEIEGGRVTTALLNADGSNFSLQLSPDPTQNFVCPNWAPKDARMACEVWDDVHPERLPGLYTVRTSGWDMPTRLTTNTLGGHDLPGDWSPDGRRFAFLREDAGNTAVFVVDVATHLERQVSEYFPDSAPPSWSPDGRRLLFDDGQGSIYTARPDGSHRHRIRLCGRRDAVVFQPGWAPDGRHIVFDMFTPTSPESGVIGIYTATADGGHVRPVITSTDALYENADWGPAPRRH